MTGDAADDRRHELIADGVLTLPEAQDLSRLSRGELYSRMNRGELPYVKLGRRRMIPRRAVLDMLAGGLVAAGPPG